MGYWPYKLETKSKLTPKWYVYIESITCFLQVQDDLKQGVIGTVPIPLEDAGKEEVIAALVANVETMIKADRKITALKQLQVSKYEFKEIKFWSLPLG